MAKKQKAQQGELIPADQSPQWSAITTEDGVHRLLYGKKRMQRGTRPSDFDRFRAIAEHSNKQSLKPRQRIECFADMPSHPVKPLKASERSLLAPVSKSPVDPSSAQ